MVFRFRNKVITCDSREKYLMGIINTTPDSFSDGGKNLCVDDAIKTAISMIGSHASFLDIGGESTRPGFFSVSADEEIGRTVPVIQAIRAHSDIPISIDTTKAIVAEAALKAGADVVNDISAMSDPGMPAVVSRYRAGCILMHHDAVAETADVVDSVIASLQERLTFATNSTGLSEEYFCVDPGIGFGKKHVQALALLRRLPELHERCARPVLLGISRKSFIGYLSEERIASRRDSGTMAAAIATVNGYSIFRVHDIPACYQALKTYSELLPADQAFLLQY